MESMLINAGLSTTGVAIVILVYKLFQSVLGKRLISDCCGRKLELGINIKPMIDTPIENINPMLECQAESVKPPSNEEK